MKKILDKSDLEKIQKDAEWLKESQEKVQDISVLPTLTLDDIPPTMELTKIDKKMVSKVKTHFIEQPTNGITHLRFKVNMKNLPLPLWQFVPLFVDLLPHIGTKNFEYTTF